MEGQLYPWRLGRNEAEYGRSWLMFKNDCMKKSTGHAYCSLTHYIYPQMDKHFSYLKDSLPSISSCPSFCLLFVSHFRSLLTFNSLGDHNLPTIVSWLDKTTDFETVLVGIPPCYAGYIIAAQPGLAYYST